MNILIPMAGAGKRFIDQGINVPKPLIDINGKTMIQRVVESLNIDGKYIFIVQEAHLKEFDLEKKLGNIKPKCKILMTEQLTEGAACTALLAENIIDNDEELLISDCDSLVYFDKKTLGSYYSDGAILTFRDDKPCWSFVETEGHLKKITNVAEKKQISTYASSGRYFWKKGSDFVYYAKKMINDNFRVNNEFYISPVYNYAINDNKLILNIDVDYFFNLGTPDDLNDFKAKMLEYNL